jgi:hypothetical protein
MKIVMTLAWIILLTPVNAFAERVATNMDGVIIKNVECFRGMLRFVVSNKSTVPLSKIVIVTVFDSDSDPVDNFSRRIELRPVSGNRYTAEVTCSDEHSYAFRFE